MPLTNQFLVPILGRTKLPKISVPDYMTPFSEFCIFKHVVHIQIFRINCTHKINKTNNVFIKDHYFFVCFSICLKLYKRIFYSQLDILCMFKINLKLKAAILNLYYNEESLYTLEKNTTLPTHIMGNIKERPEIGFRKNIYTLFFCHYLDNDFKGIRFLIYKELQDYYTD